MIEPQLFIFGLLNVLFACRSHQPIGVIPMNENEALTCDKKKCFTLNYIHDSDTLTFPLDCSQSIFFDRLMEWPYYMEKLALRHHGLRSDGLFSVEIIKHMIQENDALIPNGIAQNFERWPINDDWYFDQFTYQQEKELMIDFVESGLKQVDERFSY